MNTWTLAPPYVDTETANYFGSLDAVFALEGDAIARDPLSQVIRVEAGGRRFYVKRYTGAGKNILRRWIGRPRVQAEWENLQAFADWDIPTAAVVGFGLERAAGGFVRGAMITEEIPDTEDLAKLAKNADPRLRNPVWVDAIVRQVAAITRKMHDRGFAHNDLKWRNLLVTGNTEPRVFLIDCPSGMRWPQPFLDFRIIKDLACLDKVAKYQFSRSQRLRFYMKYTGQRRLSPQDKRRIRKILRYFEGRE